MSKKRAAEADPSPNLFRQMEEGPNGNISNFDEINPDVDVANGEEESMQHPENEKSSIQEQEEADADPEEDEVDDNLSMVDAEEQEEYPRPNEVNAAQPDEVKLVPNRVGYAATLDNQGMILNQIRTDSTTQTTLVELSTAYWTASNTDPRRTVSCTMQAIPVFSPFRSLATLQGIQILLNYFAQSWYRLQVNTQGGSLPFFRFGMCSRVGAYVPAMFALVTSHQFQKAFDGAFHTACINDISPKFGNNRRFLMFWITHINEIGMNFRLHGRGFQYVEQEGLTVLEALLLFYLRAFHRHILASHIQRVFYYFPLDSIEAIVETMDSFIDEHGRVMQEKFAFENFLHAYVRPIYWNLFVPTVVRATDVMGIIPHEFYDADNMFGLPKEDVFENIVDEAAEEEDENDDEDDDNEDEDQPEEDSDQSYYSDDVED